MKLLSRTSAVFLSMACIMVLAEFVVPPAPVGHILDEVGMLSPVENQGLEKSLSSLETETHHQVGIAILKSLQGRTIEEVSITLARTWGVGQKGLDNGLLILIAPAEREMRIEVGRGLEGVMTDLMSKRIIDEYLTPAFQKEQYFDGIASAITAMSPILRGEVVDLPAPKSALIDTIAPFGFLILFFGWGFLSVLSASKSWWLGGVVGVIVGLVLRGIIGGGIGLIIGLLLDFFLSKYVYQKIPLIRNFQNTHSGGFGGGFGGGSSGGFGGGGFGGGGASGRW
ncbi:MAG: TPM domain-containing protein [Candidatus Gracilibacteria bacterium]